MKEVEKLMFMKHTDNQRNRIIIPKFIVEKFGKDYLLEVNIKTGVMTLTPIKKGE